MAYKFQFGQAILSGALDQEGDVQIKDQAGATQVKLDDNGIISGSAALSIGTSIAAANSNFAVSAAGAVSAKGVAAGGAITTATSIDGTGDLTMGTITMPGFTVDADGDTVVKTLATPDDGTIGSNTNADLLTLAAAAVTVKANSDFTIAKAGGLNLADGAVTSTAAELNLVDGSSAGSVVASKAAIYNARGGINSNELTGTLSFSLDVAANGGVGMTPFDNSANVADLKISASFMAAAVADVAVDQIVMLDSDGSVKRESFADYAATLKGTSASSALKAASGVLSLDIDSLGAENIATGDTIVFNDDTDDGLHKITFDNVITKAPALLTAAAIDVSADHFMFLDGGATGDAKSESIADLVAGMAGAGLAASGGQLSVQGNTVTAITDGTSVAEGYNFCTGSSGGVVSLPASPDVGDVVTVKLGSSGNLTLNKGSADHRIDGQEAILLESPFAAVTMVYMVADAWRIV